MSETTYRLVLHKAAVREIRKLPTRIRQRVKAAIDRLITCPVPPGATRLKGRSAAYRLRVEDYRVIYEVHATEVVVYIVGVAHRREVYLRLLRRR